MRRLIFSRHSQDLEGKTRVRRAIFWIQCRCDVGNGFRISKLSEPLISAYYSLSILCPLSNRARQILFSLSIPAGYNSMHLCNLMFSFMIVAINGSPGTDYNKAVHGHVDLMSMVRSIFRQTSMTLRDLKAFVDSDKDLKRVYSRFARESIAKFDAQVLEVTQSTSVDYFFDHPIKKAVPQFQIPIQVSKSAIQMISELPRPPRTISDSRLETILSSLTSLKERWEVFQAFAETNERSIDAAIESLYLDAFLSQHLTEITDLAKDTRNHITQTTGDWESIYDRLKATPLAQNAYVLSSAAVTLRGTVTALNDFDARSMAFLEIAVLLDTFCDRSVAVIRAYEAIERSVGTDAFLGSEYTRMNQGKAEWLRLKARSMVLRARMKRIMDEVLVPKAHMVPVARIALDTAGKTELPVETTSSTSTSTSTPATTTTTEKSTAMPTTVIIPSTTTVASTSTPARKAVTVAATTTDPDFSFFESDDSKSAWNEVRRVTKVERLAKLKKQEGRFVVRSPVASTMTTPSSSSTIPTTTSTSTATSTTTFTTTTPTTTTSTLSSTIPPTATTTTIITTTMTDHTASFMGTDGGIQKEQTFVAAPFNINEIFYPQDRLRFVQDPQVGGLSQNVAEMSEAWFQYGTQVSQLTHMSAAQAADEYTHAVIVNFANEVDAAVQMLEHIRQRAFGIAGLMNPDSF